MSQPKLIATLLRSIADLLEESADEPKNEITNSGKKFVKKAGYLAGIPVEVHTDNIDDFVNEIENGIADEIESGSLLVKRIGEVKSGCKTCLNGGKGRHRNDCPRGHGPVVDHSEEPKTFLGENLDDTDGYDEARKRIDQINASEVKHQCCGSKGQRHKAGCNYGGSSFPDKVGSKYGSTPESETVKEPKSEWEEDEKEKPPAQPKSFDCDECGKTFQADPEDARCECGSNNIWPTGS